MVSSQALCIRDASWYTSPYGRKHFRCKPLRFTRKRKKASLQYVKVLLQTTAVVLQCKVTTRLIVCQEVFTKSLKILAEVVGGEGDVERNFFWGILGKGLKDFKVLKGFKVLKHFSG